MTSIGLERIEDLASPKIANTGDMTVPKEAWNRRKYFLEIGEHDTYTNTLWFDPIQARGTGSINSFLFEELKPDNNIGLLRVNQQDIATLISKHTSPIHFLVLMNFFMLTMRNNILAYMSDIVLMPNRA